MTIASSKPLSLIVGHLPVPWKKIAWNGTMLLMVILFCSLFGEACFAQDGAADNPPAVNPASENLLTWTYRSLGLKYTIAFLLMSFVAVGLLVMNILAIRRESICPTELTSMVDDCLKEKNLEGAAEIVRADDSVLARVLETGLRKLEKGKEQALEAMQVAGEEETMKLEHQLGYMALIGSVAPMVGLLGTVEGMVGAFTVIAARTTTPPPSELAKGISMALVTTLIGLYIAIPAIAIYNIMRNRFQRLILEAGSQAEELIEKFVLSVRK